MDNNDAETDSSQNWWEGTMNGAAEVCEGIDTRPYRNLMFVPTVYIDSARNQYENGSHALARFVSALGRKKNCRDIRKIHFSCLEWTGMPSDQMELLFGRVLPEHPTLEEVFLSSAVPAEYLRMFTNAIPTQEEATPLRVLHFDGMDTFSNEKVHHVAAMIRRNVPLTGLYFRDLLTPDTCPIIAHAVACNTNLVRLRIMLTSTRADTLHELATSPTLRFLNVCIDGAFDHACLTNLARALRTNCTLEVLQLRVGGDNAQILRGRHAEVLLTAFEETLEFYNYTLEQVLPWMEDVRGGRLGQLIRRNSVIRKRVFKLRLNDYDVPSNCLPFLRQSFISFPILVFRILRNTYAAQPLGANETCRLTCIRRNNQA